MMHRLFWLMVGMGLGAWTYRYFQDQGIDGLGLGDLGERGKRLTKRGQEFIESGRSFADSGRQLANEGREFAQTAMDTAQTRGREAIEKVKSQTGIDGGDMSEMATTATETVKHATRQAKGAAERMREDVHDGDA